METKVSKNAKRLDDIGRMADASLMAGNLTKDQHGKIKRRVRELELDNLFAAMALYCK